VALELPEPVRDAICRWREPVLEGDRALRGVDPAALHVTLCFLGSREASQLDPAIAAVEAVSGMPAGDLLLGEAIWLPRRRPRLLAVTVSDPGGELGRLQAGLSDELRRAIGYAPERRTFLAHVTVARGRGRAQVGARALEPPPAMRFSGLAVTLYRSHLGGGPARYQPIRRIPLDEQE
jgi:2'-5' RNA ligase